MNGGVGRHDLVDYSGSTAAITVGVNAGTLNTGGDAAGDILMGIEDITGSGFADTITGNSVINTLTGGESGDTLNGVNNNDRLYGGDGSDLIIGGRGADLVNGGSGIDTASYSNSDARVLVDLSAGTATGSGHGAGDTLISIENVIGSQSNDIITGNNGANTLTGGQGSDTLFGSGGGDILEGQAGNDTLNGGGGNDTLLGGSGADRFVFDTLTFGQDTIVGWQNGQDRLDFTALGLDHSDFTETASAGGTLLALTSNPAHSVFLAGINPATIDDSDFF